MNHCTATPYFPLLGCCSRGEVRVHMSVGLAATPPPVNHLFITLYVARNVFSRGYSFVSRRRIFLSHADAAENAEIFLGRTQKTQTSQTWLHYFVRSCRQCCRVFHPRGKHERSKCVIREIREIRGSKNKISAHPWEKRKRNNQLINNSKNKNL